MCLIMVFSFNLVIFTLLPVTTDRSISVMILRNMDTQRSMSFTPYQLEDQLDKILSKKQAVAKRLHEQVVTGNIKKTPKGYKITAQGSYLVHLFSVIDTIFNTKK